MRDLLKAILVTIVIVSVYGFFHGDRLWISKRDDKPHYTIVVSVPDINEHYNRIALFVCVAEVTENGTYCLPDGWETGSDHPARLDQKQYEFPCLNCPHGTKLFQAAAVDREGHVLVSNRLTVFR